MEAISGQKQCGILDKIEMLVGDIQRLVKGHGQGKDLQELEGQMGDKNKSDECGHCSSLSTISQHIDIIHQLINEEKTNLKLRPSPVDQQNMVNLGEVSVVDTSSIEKALNNSVVLRTIMQYLDTKDLLNVRLVAKKWEDEATSLLLSSRQNIQVKFEWSQKELKFRNKIGTLEEFTDSYYGNPLRKFPCSQFYFEYVTYLEINEAPADLFKFFFNHGHHIKSLSLDSTGNSSFTLSVLRKIIFDWTPCLKSLTVIGDFGNEHEQPSPGNEDQCKSSSDNGLQPSNLSLKHLKISSYGVWNHSVASQAWSLLIQDILLSAPNLKTIFDEDLWFTKEVVSSGKIRAVHRLKWAYFNESMIERFGEFSQARPQLTFLGVDPSSDLTENPPNNVLPALLLILQSSRDTLKTLILNRRFDLLDGASHMELPVMKNLQEFVVTEWNSLEGGQERLLPGISSLQKSFPRLKALHIDEVGEKEINGDVGSPFGNFCNASTTVEELTIGTASDTGCRFEPSWLGQALHLYPNVRVLHLEFYGTIDEMPELFRAIWTSWNASSLEELRIQLPGMRTDDYTEIIDQALTGFDRETCKILQKSRCCTHCGENLERGPSILDMTKLKLFHLTCKPRHFPFPLFSRVSVRHAFLPLKRKHNLRVKVQDLELRLKKRFKIDP